MQRVLMVEYGGMGEVLCNLYSATGKSEYLNLAKRFNKKWFFDPLAAHRDELKGLHVNTHIPQVIAAARLYELTGDKYYWNIADYFWNEVTTQRSYCTGGTSNFETWRTEPGILSTQLSPHTTEDCCAYNMMKLTRHLFGWSPQARYMDYYERTLFNHRIGTIDPETGTTAYYLPLGSGYSKIYAKPFDSFWCCNGTAAEEFAKLTDTIYFHEKNTVFVNLYVASELDWPERGIRLTQQTSFPEEQGTTMVVSAAKPVDIDLKLRIPYWAKTGSVQVNGRTVPAFADPGSYLVLRGPWQNVDRIQLHLPMHLHAAPMPDKESLQAVMYGPLVMASRFEEEPRDKWYRHFAADEKREAAPNLQFEGKPDDPSSWLEPSAGKLIFHTVGQAHAVARKLVKGKGLAQLLSRPLRGRVGGHIEVQNTTPIMGQYQKHVEDLEADGGHGEEVDGHQLLGVNLEECAPGLRRGFAGAHQVFADTALTDVEAEFEEFAMDTGCTSRRILPAHLSDQRSDLGRDDGSSGLAAEFPWFLLLPSGFSPDYVRLILA